MWTLSPRAKLERDSHIAKIDAKLKAAGKQPIDDEYAADAIMFRDLPFGHVCRHEFLLRLYGHQWPEDMEIEVDGYQNYWAVRMATELCRRRRLTLLGCGSSGKSYSLAGYSYTVWKTNALWSSVYMSTTSAEAGEARAYGTVKGLHKKDRYRIGKLIDSLKVITLDEETRNEDGEKERDYRNCVKAVLIKRGAEGENAIGTICGRKNRIVLWSCDELAFMDVGVLDARVNLFSNATYDGWVQFVGVGNGPEEGTPLYIDGEPFGPEFPDGWRSIDPDVHEGWTTKTGYALYFNGKKSPNLMVPKGKRPPFNKIMDWKAMDEMASVSGGEDTPMFWKQVIGLPPSVDVPDKIITHKLLESNKALDQPVWMNTERKIVAGLDLGFRDGGDPCVLSFAQVGTEETGKKVASFMGDARVVLPQQSSKDAFEKQIAVQVIDRCRNNKCHDLALDVTGDGGILLQHIEKEAREQSYQLNVRPISFSGTADDNVKTPGDKRKPTEIYANKMSQLWGQMRLCIINGVVRGLNTNFKCVRELCGRRFNTDEKRRFLVEKKSEYKKRLRHSPDASDSAVLCLFCAVLTGLEREPVSDAQKAQENRDKWQENMAPAEYSSHGTLNAYTGH